MEKIENGTAEIYGDDYADHILRLALDVGEGMLRNGGEVSRVEDTIERICRAYGAAHVEVFTIISVINAAIRMPDGSYSSQLRRIKSTATNLGALERFNALSRKICQTRPPLPEFDRQIREVKRARIYHPVLHYLASAAATGGFALFFGGSFKDTVVATLLGVLIAFVDLKSPKRINSTAKTVVSAFLASALAILCDFINLADSADAVIISAIMILVPGVAFGTAMRDLLYGDLIAGTLKTLQAVISALMIAFGYMISYSVLEAFDITAGGAVSAPDFEVFFKPIFFIATVGSFIGSVAFAVIFRVSPRHILYGGICGTVTYVIYYAVEFFTGGMVFVAAFISTVFAALFSEIASRRRRAPTIVFLIPGVIPTVPGGALYRTMRYLLEENWLAALDAFLATMQTALGIAGGIVLVSIIYGGIMERLAKRKIKTK